MRPMNVERRCFFRVAPVALALTSWLPTQVTAAELEEAQVTQVVQDVKVVPPGAAARPAAVNERVRQGNAVQTGVQSRSELTFKDKTITRLGEKTSFTVGGGGRTVELGSGQFLLYVPKKSGGARVKMGAVTAAITGTTVLGNVAPSGVVEFTVLEGTACIHLEGVGQYLMVGPGQRVVYDPVANRLEDPVDVDIQKQLTSPLVTGFRRLPSAPLIDEAIAMQHRAAAPDGDLLRAVQAAGASSTGSATPDQFIRAFNSLVVRTSPQALCDLVARAARARPDLADRIAVAAVTAGRPVRGYSRDYKQPVGKETSCDWVQCIIRAATGPNPRAYDAVVAAILEAAPMLRDCIAAAQPCPPANVFLPPYIIAPPNQEEPPPVSPEQPPTTSGGD
jgi:hypothetical protein